MKHLRYFLLRLRGGWRLAWGPLPEVQRQLAGVPLLGLSDDRPAHFLRLPASSRHPRALVAGLPGGDLPMKPILCLDFDGVLHSYSSGWEGADQISDPPVPGAIGFLVAALDHFQVAILSSRSHQWGGRRAMKNWIRGWLVEFRWARGLRIEAESPELTAMEMQDEYRRWARETVGRIKFPFFKPAAMVTLDDRALTFTGTWPDLATLLAFKPWNKKEP